MTTQEKTEYMKQLWRMANTYVDNGQMEFAVACFNNYESKLLHGYPDIRKF